MTVKTYKAHKTSMTLAELAAVFKRNDIDYISATFTGEAWRITVAKKCAKYMQPTTFISTGPTIEAAIRAALGMDE